ncbi:MAG: hypothetical protein JSW68_14950 [Burkholderiales bacterium]|nr:MAG: hypothetical protein JSW68_14950 [Burkholderiales bacterium]
MARTRSSTSKTAAAKPRAASGAPRRKPSPAGTVRPRRKAAGAPETRSGHRDTLGAVAGQLRSAAEQLLDWGGRAADLTIGVGGVIMTDPQRRAALARVGRMLRSARESVGMTIEEVSQAADLSDPALLALAEQGKAALPFEVLLRLAALLARNDPIAFVLRIMREHDPGVWKAMQRVGVDRLAVHAGREYEFLKVYRARDAARELGESDFRQVLQFVGAALDLALALHAGKPRRRR